MRISASKLRQDIYRILDEVLTSRVPVEIERKGRLLRIIAVDDDAGFRLDRLEPHPDAVCGDPSDLVQIEWSGEWRP